MAAGISDMLWTLELIEQTNQQGGLMNARFLLVVGFSAAAIMPSVAADLSGQWVISGMGNPTCTFTQSGDFFRGRCEGPGAKGQAVGIVAGDMVRWTYYWDAKADDHPGAFVFGGQISPDGSIKGIVLNTRGTAAGFIARRQQNSKQESTH